MRKIMLGMLLVVVAIMASAEGDGESPELTGPFPVTASPAGDFPVGYWECWLEHAKLTFNEIAVRNIGFYPRRCAVALHYHATGLELLPEGYGWVLAVQTDEKGSNLDFDPEAAFRIEGADRLYSRAGEMRWALNDDQGEWKACDDPHSDGCLLIQTTRNQRFSADVLSRDVIRLTDTYYGTKRLLYRIGSQANRDMMEFRECVKANDGRNLFDVVPCQNPLPGAAKIAGS